MEQSMTELMNHTTDMGQAQMFSRDWYNEYFLRAAAFPTPVGMNQPDSADLFGTASRRSTAMARRAPAPALAYPSLRRRFPTPGCA